MIAIIIQNFKQTCVSKNIYVKLVVTYCTNRFGFERSVNCYENDW